MLNSVSRFYLDCVHTGQSGYAIRMYPYHKNLSYKFDMKMIIWS